METNNKKNEEANAQETKRFERKPNFDSRVKLSKDGKYWIVELVQTLIFPRKYLDVISQNHLAEVSGEKSGGNENQNKRKGKRNADSNGQGN